MRVFGVLPLLDWVALVAFFGAWIGMAFALVAWFSSAWAFMGATALAIGVLYVREFRSAVLHALRDPP